MANTDPRHKWRHEGNGEYACGRCSTLRWFASKGSVFLRGAGGPEEEKRSSIQDPGCVADADDYETIVCSDLMEAMQSCRS